MPNGVGARLRPGQGQRGWNGGLRWLLGAIYMRLTLAAVIVLEVIGLILLAQGVLYTNGRIHPFVAETLGPVAAELLEADADPRALRAYIERPVSMRETPRPLAVSVPQPPNGYTLVFDAAADVWFDNRDPGARSETATGAERDPPLVAGQPFRRDRALATTVLDEGRPVSRRGLVRTAYAAPLTSTDGAPIGAMLHVSTLLPATPGLVLLGVLGLAFATLFVVVIGTVFGLYASRPLVRRIEALSVAADAWSHGDFSRAVHDPEPDELGRLSRRLDRMARQIGDLMATRQALAGTRERTRLARELHDSVKQQVFAASMLIGAARSAPAEEADRHLASAERLVQDAKQELSDLIHELRPVAVEGRPVDQALRSLGEAYPSSGAPTLRLDLDAGVVASPETSATLYRIAQEAVSNAVRHARANELTIRLRDLGAEIVLTIEDDGRGFMAESAKGRGVGLTSMTSRAEESGGSLAIVTIPGGGTRIEARLPHDPEAAGKAGPDAGTSSDAHGRDEHEGTTP
ncbi:MAG: sensor histidine kinase [Trueperaceae bacterium]|nr:sensor histidine kinase [Trueperaceae bacterium]